MEAFLNTDIGQFITTIGMVIVLFAFIAGLWKFFKGDSKKGWTAIIVALLFGVVLTTPTIITDFIGVGSDVVEKVPDSISQLNDSNGGGNGNGDGNAPAEGGSSN